MASKPSSTALVLSAVANGFCGSEGARTVPTISEFTGLSEGVVKSALRKLSEFHRNLLAGAGGGGLDLVYCTDWYDDDGRRRNRGKYYFAAWQPNFETGGLTPEEAMEILEDGRGTGAVRSLGYGS